MPSNNRGGNRGNRRSGRNNNPDGRNQYSGLMGTARERPFAAAAAVGGAVAAGVFLWSRRNEISDQIASLSDQFSDWREGRQAYDEFSSADTGESDSFMASTPRRGGKKTQAQISEEALTLKETGKTTA